MKKTRIQTGSGSRRSCVNAPVGMFLAKSYIAVGLQRTPTALAGARAMISRQPACDGRVCILCFIGSASPGLQNDPETMFQQSRAAGFMDRFEGVLHLHVLRGFDLGRPLGAFEEFFSLRKQIAPSVIVVGATIEGRIDPAQWLRAVHAVSRHHPLLRSVVRRERDRRPAFYVRERVTLETARVIPLDGADLDAFYASEIVRPFAPHDMPWRPSLFLGEERSIIVLSVDHTVSDGRGVVFLIEDLLTALTGNDLMGSVALAPSHDHLLGLPPNNRYMRQPQERDAEGDGTTVHPAAPMAVPAIEHVSIGADGLARIAAAAKRNETTIHGALSAAILYSGARLSAQWRQEPISYVSPIDNRPFLGAPVRLGLFLSRSAGQFVAASCDFWQLARKIRQDIISASTIARSAVHVGSLQAAMDPQMTPRQAFNLLQPWHLMVSNYGSLPIASSFGTMRISAVRPHVLSLPLSQTVSVATIDGTLSMSNVGYALVPQLLTETRSLLESI
ncbi:phthiocerol/phthiodiolone dimycocerosyl transferase family protein [Rhizobium leguminosarum]|uniref:phthiocerol/phthiodiolone dimycocerosyl transferase family protein n=1 Tax=Rhizobium TaxID=379 RepID=UPI0013EE3F36|nr:hypothetical protein [Rhizobium leguminosarum]